MHAIVLRGRCLTGLCIVLQCLLGKVALAVRHPVRETEVAEPFVCPAATGRGLGLVRPVAGVLQLQLGDCVREDPVLPALPYREDADAGEFGADAGASGEELGEPRVGGRAGAAT